MAIEVILNGDNSSAIKELHDLEIIASVERGNVNARITTEQLTFVNEYAQLIRDYINGGANGSTNGIFEGLPIQMFENGVNVFDGVVDFLNDFEITDPTTVKARIKKYESNNEVEDRASGTTFGMLYEQGIITDSDFISIPYVIEKEFNFLEFAFVSFSIYSITKDIRDQAVRVGENVATAANLLVAGAGGSVASVGYALAVAALDVIYFAAMIAMLINMVTKLFVYLISPVKYHKGIRVKKLMQKGLASIGFTYNSNIEPILDDTLVFLPSKSGIDKDAQQFKLVNGITINQPGLGIPSASDFGYTLGEMINALNTTFNAEWTIKNGFFEHHPASNSWWLQQSSWILPDVLQETVLYNANELVSDRLISFRYDIKDSNTIENFKGTTYEIQTRPITTSADKNILMRGFEKVEIPYALGNRKEKLNNFETFVKQLFVIVDNIINVFGGNGNNASKIQGRIGMLKLENDQVNIAKLMRLQTFGSNKDKMFPNDRLTFSAKYLYDLYHFEKSFLLDNYSNQYYLYKNVKVPFGFSDFNQLVQNSYFSNSNGELCKLEQIQWNVSQDFALIDYRVKKPYTTNLQEIYIEEE